MLKRAERTSRKCKQTGELDGISVCDESDCHLIEYTELLLSLKLEGIHVGLLLENVFGNVRVWTAIENVPHCTHTSTRQC